MYSMIEVECTTEDIVFLDIVVLIKFPKKILKPFGGVEGLRLRLCVQYKKLLIPHSRGQNKHREGTMNEKLPKPGENSTCQMSGRKANTRQIWLA